MSTHDPLPSHFDPDVENVILEVRDLSKHFALRRHPDEVLHGAHPVVKAVDGVSFQLRRGEVLGIVGESGCGKTTTGKMIMHLIEPTSGSVSFEGQPVSGRTKDEIFAYRRKVQMVFQDPYASMNPRFKVKDVLEEPLLIHKTAKTREERMARVRQVMEQVKMTPVDEFLERHPHMLSGGQRQRIATARTLVLETQVIVADEPVSMIDLSTRAEILHLLKGLQKDLGLSFLYITHDISTARYFTDRIIVMYLGRIVEIGPADDVIDRPDHPYTKALIAAVCEPVAGKSDTMKELPITGEIPSAANKPQGCPFHPRCLSALPMCSTLEPSLRKVRDRHHSACWLNVPEAERQAALELATAAAPAHE